MTDFVDIRSLVLSGGVKAKRQPLYIERLGGWLNIQELYGDEKSSIIQAALEQKTGKVNLGVMYAGLVVSSLRYPHPDAAPQEPVAPPEPENPTEEEKEAYDKALVKYQQALADFQHPYPLDHPHAGEKVFKPADRDAMNQVLPGQVIEQIAEPAFVLSGFKKDEIDQKKVSLRPTVIDSMITSLPSGSGDQMLTSSSAN